MFDVQKYINSGVIEAYCLGVATEQEKALLENYCSQYAIIQKALIEAQETFLQFLSTHQKQVKKNLENKLLVQIENLQFESPKLDIEKKMLSDFVQISKYSKLENWQTLVKSIDTPTDFEVHTHTLFKSDTRRLYLVWINKYIEEEAHDHTEEKFFILEGTCTCLLNNQEVKLQPGSFIDVPVGTYHNLKVTSSNPIKMIISKRKVA